MAWLVIALVVVLVLLALGWLGWRGAGSAAAPGAAQNRKVTEATGALRSVILRLVDAIQQVDDAADTSTAALNEVRVQVNNVTLADGLEEAQVRLLQEVDRVLTSNTHLRAQLESAQQTLHEQRRTIESLQAAVRIDALTHLANRPAFDERLREAWGRWQRHQDHFCLLMIDVDHFKRINDTRGHPVGDQVLAALAGCLKGQLRRSDVLARYGGEEFTTILVRTELEGATTIAEDLRGAVEKTSLVPATPRVTISVGVAAARDYPNAPALLEGADTALYRAKHEGRNRVSVAGG